MTSALSRQFFETFPPEVTRNSQGGNSDMKFKTYVCIQEDCGEICQLESVLDGDRHPKPPEFYPYYGGPCKWEGIDLAGGAT